MINLTDKEFATLRDYVLGNCGIDLSKKRMLIQGRLSGVLVKKGFGDFSAYIEHVKGDKTGTEVQMMLNRLTTNLTFFMREKEHFDFLSKVALPEFDQKFKGRQLRVWSAGCSSGEEPYTLAMTMIDYFGQAVAAKRFVVFASDISQDVLDKAQQAVYPADGMKDVPAVWLTKYFDKVEGDSYRVKDFVREMITFRPFNLMEPFRFKKPFEIIFCRNVMIYFEKNKKDRLVKQFYDWTAPGGYFLISHSENIGRTDLPFKMVRSSTFRRD